MAIDNFIPELWATKIFADYDKQFVFGGLVNRDYQGDIRSMGDTVKINAIGAITVNSWTKNSTTLTIQPLVGAQTNMTIDYADYFSFFVDDVDQMQTNPKVMGEAMRKSGVALANQADARIAGLYVDAGITMTTAAIGPSGVLAALTEVGAQLDNQDVPMDGRYMVVPPWFYANMQLAGLTKSLSDFMPKPELYRAGQVGRVLGFDIFMSNNLIETPNSGSTGREHYMLAGNRDAITFADQISSVEAFRPELQLADAVKGLHLYGMKVVQPMALVSVPFAQSTA